MHVDGYLVHSAYLTTMVSYGTQNKMKKVVNIVTYSRSAYSLFKLVGEVVLYNNNLKSYSQAKYTRGMCESVPNQFQIPNSLG
jgi:hypothetical protein